MNQIIVPIKKRNREYNIFTWPYRKDSEVFSILSKKDTIDLYIFDELVKSRKVDYKYRRITIGKRKMSKFKEFKYFKLEKTDYDTFSLTGVNDKE